MARAEAADDFSREFKAQLSHKVLTNIEKRFNTTKELTQAEVECVAAADTAQELSTLQKVTSASLALTTGFIVSRAPLIWGSAETIAAFSYHQRRQRLMLGRIAKLTFYTVLLIGSYHQNRTLNAQLCDSRFQACVLQPIKAKQATREGPFFSERQVSSMHRAYLLKANQLEKDSQRLKRYKFDPQAYH